MSSREAEIGTDGLLDVDRLIGSGRSGEWKKRRVAGQKVANLFAFPPFFLVGDGTRNIGNGVEKSIRGFFVF